MIPPQSKARVSPHYVVVMFLAAALQCLGTAWAQAPTAARESAVKAAFLSKFGGFVEWPAGTIAAGEPMVIGIVGNDAVAADLEQIVAAQPPEGRTLAMRRLRDGEPATGVYVLYIGANREGRVKDLAGSVRGPLLVVTDQEDGLRLGGTLNFVVDQGRVRFTASMSAAEARGLRLSARLLSVALVVEGRGR